MRRRHESEAGMTLLELMIAVVIIGTISAPIGAAFIIAIQQPRQTATRMSQSHSGNLVATYLNGDIASAETAVGESGTDCSGVSNELALMWQETTPFPNGTSDIQDFTAAYALVTDPNDASLFALERSYCETGETTRRHIVARGLAGDASVVATATGTAVTMTIEQAKKNLTFDFTVGGTAGVRIDGP